MTAAGEVNKEAGASFGSAENDDIIELTDEIKAAAEHDDDVIELTDEIKAAPEYDNDVIELTDEVVNSDSTPMAPDAGGDSEQAPDISDDYDARAEAALMLEDNLPSFANGELKIGDDIDDELDIEDNEQDDFVNALGMDLETDAAIGQAPDEPEENDPLPEAVSAESASIAVEAVSLEQIEAVIERIIMKILPEKIDNILSTAIEKTLTREIEKIKNVLLEDSSGDDM